MGLYLGKDKISALRTIEKETASMKAYLEAGGKCGNNNAVSFEGCWKASDWGNVTDCTKMFYDCNELTAISAMSTINVTNMERMFANCYKLTTIPEMDTGNVTNMSSMFDSCSSLTSIPAMDTSNVTDMGYMFSGCSNLESIHMHGMKVSFGISSSTKFTREALVEILNNLATVTTSPTLTMGSTNLAKLTEEDKAIATGKGWKLA